MEVIDNVISAYEAVKMNGVSQGIIALCSFIAVIIVIQKFVTAWKEAFSEGDKPVDMKQFFKLFYIYIYVFAIIMVAPFAFTIVETALGNLQNELISHPILTISSTLSSLAARLPMIFPIVLSLSIFSDA